MANLVNWLSLTMEVPEIFGMWHVLFIIIAIAVTFLLCKYRRDADDKTFRRIILIGWIIMVVFELCKEIVFSFSVTTEGTVEFNYQWYIFPYQFCSTPFYVMPFIAFLKDSKVRDSIIMFFSTFSLFAGLAVFAYPTSVFIDLTIINIQTMVHHGMQIVMGIYTAVWFRSKHSIKKYLSGCITFAALASIAIALNEIMFYAVPAIKNGETFNMFFISSHFPSTLPVLSMFNGIVPYPVFVAIYLVGFSIAGLIVYLAEVGIHKLCHSIKIKSGK